MAWILLKVKKGDTKLVKTHRWYLTFNEGKTIGNLILKWSELYPLVEILVVNDGSTNDTSRAAKWEWRIKFFAHFETVLLQTELEFSFEPANYRDEKRKTRSLPPGTASFRRPGSSARPGAEPRGNVLWQQEWAQDTPVCDGWSPNDTCRAGQFPIDRNGK